MHQNLNVNLVTRRRATVAASLGLIVQAVLTIAGLALYAYTRVEAALSLVWLGAGGLPIWAAIWGVSQFQHAEQIEAMELQQARSEGREADSLFADASDARPAARRLRRACRWGIPAVGLGTAAYLLVSGGLMLRRVPDVTASAGDPALGAALAAALAFAGFVASRYLQGMASHEPWRLLRSGASYLWGCVTVLFLMALSLAAGHFGSWTPAGILRRAIPAIGVLIGVEILFNQLLDMYRPRREGELARPAFDSRLLSLLASPGSLARTLNEAINYQFGFEITQSWFWRLLVRAFGWLLLLGVVVLLAISCVVIVEPHQQALVVRFGRLVGEPLEPGLHLKLPWPISVANRYDVTRVRDLLVGSHLKLVEGTPILWSNRHTLGAEELLMLAPPKDVGSTSTAGSAPEAGPAEAGKSPSITLAGADVFIQYRIRHVVDFARNHQDPEVRFRHIADLEVARYLLRLDIDELIGPARHATSAALQRILRDAADRERLGIEVVWVGVAGIHPAQQVADAFHETVGAEQEKQTAIQRGLQESTRLLAESVGTEDRSSLILAEIEKLESMQARGAMPAEVVRQEQRIESLLQQAGGKAAQAIAEARAYRWTVENAERGRVQRFCSEMKAFANAPQFYRLRRYLEALAEGMGNARKYLLVTDRQDLIIRGDFKDVATTFDSLDLPEKQ